MIKSAYMDVSSRSDLYLFEFRTRYLNTDRWSSLLRDMVIIIFTSCSQPHIRPASTEGPLKALIWSIFSRVLALVKIFFLIDLDPFFKSLKFFQRLKMDFWRRWRDKKKMKKKIIFFLFFLSFQTLRNKILET